MQKTFITFFLTCFITTTLIFSDWSFPNCNVLSDNDFKQVVLVGKTPLHNPLVEDISLLEPIELDFAEDGEGNVDVYFCERRGTLKMYDASENTIIVVGTLDVVWEDSRGKLDCGFTGIVFDPDFKTNHWVYLFYTPKVPTVEEEVFRLSRFRIDGTTLNMESEKYIYEFPIRYGTRWHSGFSMHFDHYGDLWIAAGKNSGDDPGSINENNKWGSCEFSSANTSSIRGSIIRIHPLKFPDSQTPKAGRGRTYTIPKGNFGDYFYHKYKKEENFIRAEEFQDTLKVLPELYAHGSRNPWTLNVEPVKRWVVWGENGINRKFNHEEHNFTKVPGFFGFPYFAGNPFEKDTNLATICSDGTITCVAGYNISARMGSGNKFLLKPENIKNPDAPVNNSKWNTGLVNLTPAIPSIHTYKNSSAMTGPIYRYDGDLQSPIKMPPHFDGIWFITDYNNGRVYALKVDDEKLEIEKKERVFSKLKLYRPLEMETGPDGALYVINYAASFNSNEHTNISRIEYSGNCNPPFPKLEEKVNPQVYYPNPGYGCTCPGDANYDENAFALDVKTCATKRKEDCTSLSTNQVSGLNPNVYISQAAIEINEPGYHRVSIQNLVGREVFVSEDNKIKRYGYESIVTPGIYFVSIFIRGKYIRSKVGIVK